MLKHLWKIILMSGIFIRLGYFYLTPPGQLPDEKFIFKRIWTNIKYPNNYLYPDKPEFYYANSEYYYPPLYYFVSSKVLTTFYSITTFSGNIEDAFVQSIYLLRLLSLFLSAGSLLIIWKIIEKLTPDYLVKLSAFCFIALLPSFASFSIAANQNNLAFFFTILFIYLSVSNYNRRLKGKDIFFVGSIFGLSILAKFDSIIAAPFILLNIPTIKNKKYFTKSVVIFSLVTLLVGGWWYIASLLKYGWFYNKYLFASAIKDYLIPFSFEAYLPTVLLGVIISFFAVFGVGNNITLSVYVYPLIIALLTLFVVKYINKTINVVGRDDQKQYLIEHNLFVFFTYAFIFNLIIFLIINLLYTYQAQGRYFFNSIIYIAISFVLALLSSLPKAIHKLVPIIIFIFFLLLNILGFGCNLQYFRGVYLFPKSLSCNGYYITVGEIEEDLLPR